MPVGRMRLIGLAPERTASSTMQRGRVRVGGGRGVVAHLARKPSGRSGAPSPAARPRCGGSTDVTRGMSATAGMPPNSSLTRARVASESKSPATARMALLGA